MSAELQPNAELEIAHVLFIDVVGYSRLLINEQSALLAELNQLVRTTHHFHTAEAAGKRAGTIQGCPRLSRGISPAWPGRASSRPNRIQKPSCAALKSLSGNRWRHRKTTGFQESWPASGSIKSRRQLEWEELITSCSIRLEASGTPRLASG